ncbi:MAG: zinc-binding dehydrogenase [Armatimonadota bacterium]|nr:zinc-binding dehydrogenase [Armatimonadota bacterium]
MRTIALEYPERGKLAFIDEGQPRDLKPTEALIETRYSGITNGTERHALMAEHFWGKFPSRHGYQHVGPVTAVGSEVKDFAPGDWTFYGEYVGHRGWNIIDLAGGNLLFKLPLDDDYKKYALLGTAGVAMKGVRRFGIKPADKVLVTGIGPIGYFSAISAKAHGAEVTVTDFNDQRLRIALEQGCDHVINAADPDYWDKLKALGKFNYIIDGSGYENLFFDIFEKGLLAYNGVICPMAVRTEARFPWSMLHQTDGRIEVSCHFGLDDLRVIIYGIQIGTIKPGAIISHLVSIDEAPRIYGIMRDNPTELFGVVFDWA